MNKQSKSPALVGINYTIFMLAFGRKTSRNRHIVAVSQSPKVADWFVLHSNKAELLMEATQLTPSQVNFELTTIKINMN